MSDVEPTTPEPAKEGGLKDQTIKPAETPTEEPADIETEGDPHGSKSGGMIGEG